MMDQNLFTDTQRAAWKELREDWRVEAAHQSAEYVTRDFKLPWLLVILFAWGA